MKNLPYVPKMILLVAIAFCIGACNKDKIDINYDITGNWKVVAYKTSKVITKTEDNTWSQFNNGDVIVSFIATDLKSGEISGKKVTNSFSGKYTIDNKGAISISNILQTLIAEPEWGGLFDSIRNAESYEIKNKHLIIYYNRRKNSIILEKVND